MILSVRGYLLFFNVINYVDEELKRALVSSVMCRNLRKATASKEIKNLALQTGLKRADDINQFKSLPTIDPAAHRGGVDPVTASKMLAVLAEKEA